MSRTVTVVLVDAAGRPLGALPPFEVPDPWWQQVASVVDGARRRHGVDVAVLRLLDADRPHPPGGHVRYLAQLLGPPAGHGRSERGPAGHGTPERDAGGWGTSGRGPAGHGTPERDAAGGVPLEPAAVDLAPHPLRQPWAEPGGPARSVAWATEELRRLGRPVTAVAQQRTWNLSAIWRLDTPHGPAWLKQLPVFARHEPTVLTWLATLPALPPSASPTDQGVCVSGDLPADTNSLTTGAGVGPVVLAVGGEGRVLVADVRGEDRYGAGEAERAGIAVAHHAVQVRAVGAVDRLVADGVPDLRGVRPAGWIRARLAGHDVSVAARLLDGLDERLRRVRDCGLPDTLVHGDLHPGNVRGDGTHAVTIDWADAFVGHPAFDILRLTEGLDDPAAARLVEAWADRWRADAPGCDPRRALDLLRPVAPLRLAAVYAMFLAGIEPAEHPYHVHDVPAALAQAAAEARR
ncbi:aminoglycoside phosphotransferase family protein [Micromonospora sp. WMMC241]|uniref:phosphotransferase family protein n=1 Tax=Micromonospora sp. WMMC241 TaxID=3015159 RepID=UPI0022B651F4|nr:aminoglycoside phosphotransferase family protein [Micromonospora sp. WMMC241]MCZ7439551.1 aminoglycoside phosphotransferase family protein [Micromonospora sp. WMMC241]